MLANMTLHQGVGAIDIEAIDFAVIQPSDEIVIQTKNSNYRFSVVDAEERRGTLSGGALGERSTEAFLVASLPNREAGVANSRGLQTHTRALFLLPLSKGLRRFITSEIVCLGLERLA